MRGIKSNALPKMDFHLRFRGVYTHIFHLLITSTDQFNLMNHHSNFSESEESERLSSQESLSNDPAPAPDLLEELTETPLHETSEEDQPNNTLSLETFFQQLELAPTSEEKIRVALDFMRSSLSQPGAPYFKGFWEAKQHAVPLFKETSMQLRSELWNEYKELCEESKRIKEILDEQSAFATEQIEIAVNALENDLKQFSELLKKIPPLEFPFPCETIQKNYDLFNALQSELNLLNTQASRINALRKELIKTDMRIRVKNKFFRQLSSAGDQVFPRRKELIKTLSNHFLEAVEEFVKQHFVKEPIQAPLFFLREEIKGLQALAKLLTLNTYSFTHTRSRLSECWDKIKDLDKERKKVRNEQRVVFKQNASQVIEQIEQFRKSVEAQEITTADVGEKVEAILDFMHSLHLGKEEKYDLRELLFQARQPLMDKIRLEEEARLHLEQEALRAKSEKNKQIKQRIQQLLSQAESLNVENIQKEKESILEEIQNASFSKLEKQAFERSFKPLKDLITEKEEKIQLSFTEDDLQALKQLKEVLNQRKERRQEIKTRIDEYSAASNKLSLDFEKALAYHEMIEAEKERLEKINEGIKEVEGKIRELNSKIRKG